jgi:hypothetical protein
MIDNLALQHGNWLLCVHKVNTAFRRFSKNLKPRGLDHLPVSEVINRSTSNGSLRPLFKLRGNLHAKYWSPSPDRVDRKEGDAQLTSENDTCP